MLILELGSPPTPRTPWFTGSGLGRPEADFSFTAAGTKTGQQSPHITYPSPPKVAVPELVIFQFFWKILVPAAAKLKSASGLPRPDPVNQSVLGVGRGTPALKWAFFITGFES